MKTTTLQRVAGGAVIGMLLSASLTSSSLDPFSSSPSLPAVDLSAPEFAAVCGNVNAACDEKAVKEGGVLATGPVIANDDRYARVGGFVMVANGEDGGADVDLAVNFDSNNNNKGGGSNSGGGGSGGSSGTAGSVAFLTAFPGSAFPPPGLPGSANSGGNAPSANNGQGQAGENDQGAGNAPDSSQNNNNKPLTTFADSGNGGGACEAGLCLGGPLTLSENQVAGSAACAAGPGQCTDTKGAVGTQAVPEPEALLLLALGLGLIGFTRRNQA